MFIYLLLLFSILLLGMFLEKNNKKTYSILICIILTLIAGLRHYTIGNDTITYLRFFNNVLSSYMTSRYEIGFIYFTLFIRRITDNFTIYLLIISFLFNYIICKLIRKDSPNMIVSFLLFFLCRFFFNEMNIMRQYISIAIIILGFKYIYKREFLQYFICIIVATLFHKSAFLCIILYFLYNVKITKKISIIICIASLVMFSLFYNVVNYITMKLNMYETYVDLFYGSNKIGNVISFIICLSIIFLSFYINKITKNNSLDKKENYYKWLLILATVTSFLSIKISIFSRIKNYFDLFVVIFIPIIVEKINGKKKFLIYFIIILLFGIYCILITHYRPNWNNIYPYYFYTKN